MLRANLATPQRQFICGPDREVGRKTESAGSRKDSTDSSDAPLHTTKKKQSNN